MLSAKGMFCERQKFRIWKKMKHSPYWDQEYRISYNIYGFDIGRVSAREAAIREAANITTEDVVAAQLRYGGQGKENFPHPDLGTR